MFKAAVGVAGWHLCNISSAPKGLWGWHLLSMVAGPSHTPRCVCWISVRQHRSRWSWWLSRWLQRQRLQPQLLRNHQAGQFLASLHEGTLNSFAVFAHCCFLEFRRAEQLLCIISGSPSTIARTAHNDVAAPARMFQQSVYSTLVFV